MKSKSESLVYRSEFDVEMPNGTVCVDVEWHAWVGNDYDPGDALTPAYGGPHAETENAFVLSVERYDATGCVIAKRSFERASAGLFTQVVAEWCPHTLEELVQAIQEQYDIDAAHLLHAERCELAAREAHEDSVFQSRRDGE